MPIDHAVVKQPRSTKRQIEANRREKAQRKQARRQERAEGGATSEVPEGAADPEQVLAALAELHRAYGEGEITLDDLEAGRADLTSRLHVD